MVLCSVVLGILLVSNHYLVVKYCFTGETGMHIGKDKSPVV